MGNGSLDLSTKPKRHEREQIQKVIEKHREETKTKKAFKHIR
jgi:hypothetical protein